MTHYNGQVLPLCPWPAVHFSSPILLNLQINARRVKWPCTRLLNGTPRLPSRQGAILVPNSRLARGNGLYDQVVQSMLMRCYRRPSGSWKRSGSPFWRWPWPTRTGWSTPRNARNWCRSGAFWRCWAKSAWTVEGTVVSGTDGLLLYYYYYWSFLYSAILRPRADSLRSHVILHEWIAFHSAFLNIHRSGVLTALAWLVPQESAARESQSRRVLCTPYNHAPCHFMQSHIRKVYAC